MKLKATRSNGQIPGCGGGGRAGGLGPVCVRHVDHGAPLYVAGSVPFGYAAVWLGAALTTRRY